MSDAPREAAERRCEPGALVLTQNVRACAVVMVPGQYQAREPAPPMLKPMAKGVRDIAEARLLPQKPVFAGRKGRLRGAQPRHG